MAINPDATIIPDKAEVWLVPKFDALGDPVDIETLIPASPSADLAALGWQFSGLIDDQKGIMLEPAVEVRPYDAFGHPQFRVKLRKGTLKTGFTALETNDVTRQIVLPGSATGKIGRPRDIQIYVLYRFVDEEITRVWVSLTPAPVEVTAHGGIVDGELSFADLVVHHTANADGDVFQTLSDEDES